MGFLKTGRLLNRINHDSDPRRKVRMVSLAPFYSGKVMLLWTAEIEIAVTRDKSYVACE